MKFLLTFLTCLTAASGQGPVFVAVDAISTLVTLKQTGWKDGEEWDKAYTYLAGGNKQLLEILQQRFEKGPVDWAAMFKR